MHSLISITEYQPLLHTISISSVLLPLLISWIQICFKKPPLLHLKLRLHHTDSEHFYVNTLFIPQDSDTSLGEAFPNTSKNSLSSKVYGNAKCSNKIFIWHIVSEGNTYTNQCKALVLKECSLTSSSSIFSDYSTFFSQLARQPGFDIQSLEISSMCMHSITFSEYDALLQKKSLKTVSIIDCYGVDTSVIRKVAALRGFLLEDTSELLEKFTLTKIIIVDTCSN